MSETKRMKVSDLQPHPKNTEIYGKNEDISDLVEKIKRSGQVHTLVATSKGIVLAGHRRMRACKELGIDEVDVEIRDFETLEEEIEFIIDNNAIREKTNEQKAREASILKQTLSVLAQKRKISNLRQNQSSDMPKMAQREEQSTEVPNSALRDDVGETGKTRDIIAHKIGMKSGQDVDRAIKTIKRIDELKEKGQSEEAEILQGVLNNRGISAAEKLAKNIDIVKDIPEDEKEAIKAGKKSPNSYIKKADDNKKREDIIKDDSKDDADIQLENKVKNESKADSIIDFLSDIQNEVKHSSKTMTACLEELLPKQYVKSNKREITDRIQSKIRSYIETISSIQELIASMEISESDMNLINVREDED